MQLPTTSAPSCDFINASAFIRDSQNPRLSKTQKKTFYLVLFSQFGTILRSGLCMFARGVCLHPESCCRYWPGAFQIQFVILRPIRSPVLCAPVPSPVNVDRSFPTYVISRPLVSDSSLHGPPHGPVTISAVSVRGSSVAPRCAPEIALFSSQRRFVVSLHQAKPLRNLDRPIAASHCTARLNRQHCCSSLSLGLL